METYSSAYPIRQTAEDPRAKAPIFLTPRGAELVGTGTALVGVSEVMNMTITLATLLGLFTTGLSPIGLLGGVITLIVGVNFWLDDREALVLQIPASES